MNYLLTSPNYETPFTESQFNLEQKQMNQLCTRLLRNELHTIFTTFRFGCSRMWRDIYYRWRIQACINLDRESDVRREEGRSTTRTEGGVTARVSREYLHNPPVAPTPTVMMMEQKTTAVGFIPWRDSNPDLNVSST